MFPLLAVYSAFSTTTVVFHKRIQEGTRPDGQPLWGWESLPIEGCLYTIDRPETQDEQHRYQSDDRLTVHIPKGNDHIDFSGYIVGIGGSAYVVEGNAVTYMPENTPGAFNRTVTAYRRAEVALPEED